MTKALIIEAVFYDDIAKMLMEGATAALDKAGCDYDILSVPGALEIPAAMNFAASGKDPYDAYIALGCVIRGETSHYDIVCGESARGIHDLAIRHNLALGNGILTVENMDQAIERADPSRKNKGGGAAEAALQMLDIKNSFA